MGKLEGLALLVGHLELGKRVDVARSLDGIDIHRHAASCVASRR
jgi:hypothetical protein